MDDLHVPMRPCADERDGILSTDDVVHATVGFKHSCNVPHFGKSLLSSQAIQKQVNVAALKAAALCVIGEIMVRIKRRATIRLLVIVVDC